MPFRVEERLLECGDGLRLALEHVEDARKLCDRHHLPERPRGALDVQGGGSHLWYAIGAAVLTCVCLCLGIFRRINQTEELHITS